MMIKSVRILAVLAALPSLPAMAQSAGGAAESSIAQVTLYPGSATVQRVAKVATGSRRLVFQCLSANLDVQSLTVSADASVRLGELSVLNEEREANPACAGTPLDTRIRELEDKRAALGAESDALGIVTGYLKSVGSGPDAPGGARVAVDPRNVAATADALRRTGQDALLRQNQIARAQEELDRQLKPLLAQRSRTLAGRTRVTSVSVNLDAPTGAEVRLSYQVNGPGWTPTYRALLDTSTQKLRIERQAQVAQNTGEDWQGVKMRLSTGQPRAGTTGPLPNPWRIGIAEPQVALESAKPAFAKKTMLAAAPAPAPMAMNLRQADEPVPSFDVTVFDAAFATEFAVPQRIDVPSGGQRVTLMLGAQDLGATLMARTNPAVDASAWLVAELAQPEGVWPQGPLQLYRDGAYVGSSFLRAGGKDPLNLSFGRDELVAVSAEPQKDMRSSTGFVGSRAQRSVQRAYSVENRHRTPTLIQVLEASPVSVDERVVVDTKFDPAPESKPWNEQPGVIQWRRQLDAGQSARFVATYTITYPKDSQLEENR